MNLPNKLTMLRVIMIPFFVVFMILSLGGAADIAELRVLQPESFRMHRYIALAIFCAASLTDFFDGQIARKYHLVTDFGKFMDPLADKLLVCSALILLTAEGSLSVVVVIVIIAREFIISGFRLIASDNGIVIAASWWGKFKTTSQMILCIVLILPGFPVLIGSTIVNILTAAVLLLTIVSLADYMIKNIKVITDGGM
ncbi:MAG: CDP-diacylglycerol--glycerol-3-phosphate 3-phosphatidyltransferase [Eubacteriales bacterium]|nr:CDP-diacylglycerol--glycerol-3-phosphate 3-phosphatidyltransferase [Eubacteriales bacterium]